MADSTRHAARCVRGCRRGQPARHATPTGSSPPHASPALPDPRRTLMTQKTHRRRRIVLATCRRGDRRRRHAEGVRARQASAPVRARLARRSRERGAGNRRTAGVPAGRRRRAGVGAAEIAEGEARRQGHEGPVARRDRSRDLGKRAAARASEESLRAQQQSTAAQLTQAELAFKRQQAMLPDDATSRESFEAARATLDAARDPRVARRADPLGPHPDRDRAGEPGLHAHRRADRRRGRRGRHAGRPDRDRTGSRRR